MNSLSSSFVESGAARTELEVRVGLEAGDSGMAETGLVELLDATKPCKRFQQYGGILKKEQK